MRPRSTMRASIGGVRGASCTGTSTRRSPVSSIDPPPYGGGAMAVGQKQRTCQMQGTSGTEVEFLSRFMCGICGIAYSDPHARGDQDLVASMRDAMSHRGPDGAGIAVLS